MWDDTIINVLCIYIYIYVYAYGSLLLSFYGAG